MDKTNVQFSHLPSELKILVIKKIKSYSEFKALSLTTKELSDLTKPYLYHKVDLRVSNSLKVDRIREFIANEKYRLVAKRISSLLLQPSNLRFVVVLKTGKFGSESTKLINQFLPLLTRKSLTKFSYIAPFTENFSTPLQLQNLWKTQKNLQNLKCCPYMAPFLIELLQHGELSHNTLMNSIIKLSIQEIVESLNPYDRRPSIIYWPLRNLNLYHLKKFITS